MKVKCEYCDAYIDSDVEVCPHCGGPNRNMIRHATGVPKTIEELKNWAAEHKLPLEQMHYYLGEDYRGPKAYGIYKADDGDFVVYKNKSDGTRAVRYKGTDEAYAVNELYEKMKLNVIDQKASNPTGTKGERVTPSASGSNNPKHSSKLMIIIAIFVIILILAFVAGLMMDVSDSGSSSGYAPGYSYSTNYGYTSGSYSSGSYSSDSYSSGSYDSYNSGYQDSGSSDPYWSDNDDSDDWDSGFSYSGSSWDSSSNDWDSDWLFRFRLGWLRNMISRNLNISGLTSSVVEIID